MAFDPIQEKIDRLDRLKAAGRLQAVRKAKGGVRGGKARVLGGYGQAPILQPSERALMIREGERERKR